MNKLFLFLISLVLVSFSVSATLISLDTEFVDYNNHSAELGNTIHVEQGEPVTFFIWATSNTGQLSYRAFIYENSQITDVVSHTIYSGCQGNFCDVAVFKDFDTSSLELGTHEIRVLASDDNTQNYDTSKILTLVVDPVPVNHAPERPSNPNPIVGAVNVSRIVTLSWTANDIDNDPLTYKVYLSNDRTFTEQEVIADNLKNPNYQLTNLEYNTHYYWKVIVSDGSLTAESYVWDFTTTQEPINNYAPNEPINPFPANDATGIERDLTVGWEASDPDGDVLTYTLYFGTDSNPTNLIATNIPTNNYHFKNLLEYNTKYYWKVIASDGSLETSSQVWSFTTKNQTFINHAPVIQSITDKRAECSEKFTYQVVATDQDNDTITYSDNTNLFNINSTTGLISFTPSCTDRGDYTIVITATDSKGAITTETFDLEIYRRSSGGSSNSNNNDDEGETIILKKLGQCLDDNDNDKYGLQTVIYKTVNKLTNEVLSLRSEKQVCLLEEEPKQEEPEQELYDVDFMTIGFIALGFVALSLAIILYAYKKLF